MPSKPISTDQDFQGTNRITGLPPAIAPGQPIPYEQLGIEALKKRCVFQTECLTASASCLSEFSGVAISSGTISGPTGVSLANRPGMVRLRNSTAAGSGYAVSISVNQILLRGQEFILASIIPSAFAGNTTRFGFLDTATATDAVDGAYIEINVSGVASGKTANNSTRSSTASTFTLTAGTYYWMSVLINSDATLATFAIRAENGTALWADTLNTNIPTTSGRETGAGIISTNSGTIAVDMLHLDFLGMELSPARA